MEVSASSYVWILMTHKSVCMTTSSVDVPDSENQVIGRADAVARCSLLATAAHCNRVEEGIRVCCDAER